MSARLFLALQAVHRDLDEGFLDHQAALVARDLAAARAALERFRGALAAHMALEEEILLPAYAELAGSIPGGGLDLVLAEHRKLERMLAQLFDALALLEQGPPLAPRDVVLVLDREFTFKHLLQHHDQRETNLVYPALDRELGAARRAALWARIDAHPSRAR